MSEKHDKTAIVIQLASLIGLREAPKMSTGSTEPREIFVAINDELGLGLDAVEATKPEMARGIVERAGMKWLPTHESRGGTVTRDGLLAVLAAVQFFLR